MTAISALTYKVVSFSEIPNYNTDESVDWAIEMVEQGYNTPALLMLASQSEPTNYFQTVEYLKNALGELHLEIKLGKSAIISFASYYIKQLAEGVNVKQNLKTVYQLNQDLEQESILYDFTLLYWAWGDLDYGNEYQCYWSGADKENIESIVIATAKKWLAENSEHYAQQHGIAKIQA